MTITKQIKNIPRSPKSSREDDDKIILVTEWTVIPDGLRIAFRDEAMHEVSYNKELWDFLREPVGPDRRQRALFVYPMCPDGSPMTIYPVVIFLEENGKPAANDLGGGLSIARSIGMEVWAMLLRISNRDRIMALQRKVNTLEWGLERLEGQLAAQAPLPVAKSSSD